MNKSTSNNKIIKKYKRPLSFFILSLTVPWALWFFAGYQSHIEPYTKTLEWAVGISSITGLLAPVIIALIFMMPNKELRTDFLNRFFNFKTIKGKYIFFTFFLLLISILLAQVIYLYFGYPTEQFSFRGSFTFTSALFPVWFLLLAAPVFKELAWHSY